MVFDDEIYLYVDKSCLPLELFSIVQLDESFRTVVAGNFEDKGTKRLKSFIYFLFMDKGFVGNFVESKNVSFGFLKSDYKRLTEAKRKGVYDKANSRKRWGEVTEKSTTLMTMITNQNRRVVRHHRSQESSAVVAVVTNKVSNIISLHISYANMYT